MAGRCATPLTLLSSTDDSGPVQRPRAGRGHCGLMGYSLPASELAEPPELEPPEFAELPALAEPSVLPDLVLLPPRPDAASLSPSPASLSAPRMPSPTSLRRLAFCRGGAGLGAGGQFRLGRLDRGATSSVTVPAAATLVTLASATTVVTSPRT